MKRPFIAASLLLLACGGNYSNEDIDFQLALPEKEDLAAKLPAQALELADAAEYYRSTRGVVKLFNGVGDAFLGIIDYVRGYPPTDRNGARRIWGPFLHQKHRDWALRMVIDRVGDPIAPSRFEYQLEFRAARDRSGPWGVLLSGSFAPGGGVRRGEGSLHFASADARAAQYPLDGLTDTEEFVIEYQTRTFPITVKMVLSRFPGREPTVYQYLEAADGSGTMVFDFPKPFGMDSVDMRSRWNGSGAGRADLRLSKVAMAGSIAVDCWGIDTRASYVFRQWMPASNSGTESSCVFPAP